MKKLCFALLLAAAAGCSAEREIQADMVSVTLVKIENVVRYPNLHKKLLTWKTIENVTITSYAPMENDIALGTVTLMLLQK